QAQLQDCVAVVISGIVIFYVNSRDCWLQVQNQVTSPAGEGCTYKEVGGVEIVVIIVRNAGCRSPVYSEGTGLEATHAQFEDSFIGVTNQAAVDDQLAVLQAQTNTAAGIVCAGLKLYRSLAVFGGLAPFLEEAPGRAQFSGRGWGLGMSQRTDAGEGGAQSDCVF